MFQLTLVRQLMYPVTWLYRAWTDPEMMQQWLLPAGADLIEVTANAVQDGEYHLRFALAGKPTQIHGHYRKLHPPDHLILSWHWPESPQTTLIDLRLNAASHLTTEMMVRHTAFADAESRNQQRAQWEHCLRQLQQMPMITPENTD